MNAPHLVSRPSLARHLLLLLTTVAAGSACAGDMIDETRAVDPNGVIDIDLVNGSLRVVGWDRDEFHVSGELSDDAEGFELRERGNGLHFEEDLDRRRGCFGFGDCRGRNGANLLIEVPRSAILRVEGTNIDIDISGLERNIEVELVNGNIDASNLRGAMDLKTVNGDIRTSGLDGRIGLETINGRIIDVDSGGTRIELRAVNGDIESNTRSGRIRVDNVNGEIELELGEIEDLEVSTVGGDVEIIASLAPLAHLMVSSVHGRIDLALPESSSASFLVSTSVGGRINNGLSDDLPVRKNRYINSSDLAFTLGAGDADVHLSTVSGNITLCAAASNAGPGC